jgi:putative ATP-dependent endonuclease of OLD family
VAPRLTRLSIQNLRSVGSPAVVLDFPTQGPLVLLGENNAGKSNLTRAIDLLFGERWPTTHMIEDHDFFGRDPDGLALRLHASIEGLDCPYCGCGIVDHVRWIHDAGSGGDPIDYSMSCSNCPKTYMKKEVRQSLFAMKVDTDRRLSYQLSYTTQFTLLSRLMHRFHERLTADPTRRAKLEEIFQTLLGEFAGVSEFQLFRTLLADTADDFGQNLSYRLDIDFSAYDPSNFFRSLRVHPQLDGDVRSFDELGTGQEQILALAFSYAYAKAFGEHETLILIIDEPESHLHPLAQQWLASRLDTLATAGLQLVLTTHSPHFVDLSQPGNMVVVRKSDGDSTRVTQVSAEELSAQLVATGAGPLTTGTTVGHFYAASATTEIVSALFSRLCVLVEGPTESLALPELLRLVGFDALRKGIAVVSVEGVGNIAKWCRLFSVLGTPVYCLFDTDSDKSGIQAGERLGSRQDIMRAMGKDTALADEQQMSNDPLHVQPQFATFNHNFEVAMVTLLGEPRTSAYAASVKVVGESKALRARQAARQLTTDQLSQAAETSLHELADAFCLLLGEGPGNVSDSSSEESPNGSELKAPAPWDEPPF